MHIAVGDVWCEILGTHPEFVGHWEDLYKTFVYPLPDADRQYLVQLKKLCIDLVGKTLYSYDHLEREAKEVIKKNRWHEKLWSWYVEKAILGVPTDPVAIRRRLSELMTAKGKDATISLIDVQNGYRFYTGHLPGVLDFCFKRNIPVSFADGRHQSSNVPPFNQKHTMNLRPYQNAALIHAINNKLPPAIGHWYRGIFQVPTGGGKTEIAIALTMMYGGKTVFIVNRKELLHQTWERFTTAYNGQGLIGLIGDGNVIYTGNEKVVIASAQTLWSISKKQFTWLQPLISSSGQLIIDEAHGLAAGNTDEVNTVVQLCNMFQFSAARWALTATPLMRDELSNALLTGVTGAVIYKITTGELIKLGYLTPPKITFTKVTHRSGYEDPINKQEMKRPPGSQWTALYDFMIKQPARNKAIADIITNIPTPAIVLVKRLDHVNYINHYLPNPLPFLKGTSSTEEREAAKQKLRSGEYPVLCVTTIFDEGVDIPEIRAIIMAGGGKSDIKTMQRLGRGLRISQGKHSVAIYDFIDHCDDAPGWVPMKHSRDRIALFKKEGFTIVQK